MMVSVVPALKARVLAMAFVKNNAKLQGFIEHPAGPFTIHFWAPTFKWGISIANLADYNRPAELISVPQQCAVTATGLIWTRYSFVITPINLNLASVNGFMFLTGAYQLWRRYQWSLTQKAVDK